MTVSDMREKLSLEIICEGEPDREVTSGYCGDLLSWVMGRAPADSVWITIMSNINVIAVASLADVACIILAEGAALDPDAKNRADLEGMNVYSCKSDAFTLCRLIEL